MEVRTLFRPAVYYLLLSYTAPSTLVPEVSMFMQCGRVETHPEDSESRC